jgi:cation:H+ antiporter
MSGLAASAVVVLGLLMLAGGGEALIRGATALARMAGVTPAVIGLTIVAAGTSLPELVVSLLAQSSGRLDIALGNVVGSNIFNLVGALALTALITALPVHGTAVKLEWPFMALATCVLVLLCRDRLLDRIEGAFMVGGFALFTGFMVWLARREVAGPERQEFEAEAERRSLRGSGRAAGIAVAAVVGGLILLLGGGRLLVVGAVELARIAGLSERVIGLTVVAVGTSMPEVAASVVAAVRGRTDVAVANLIGSNIFNVLGILGTAALIHPIPVSDALLGSDMIWMMVTALGLFPILWTGMRVTRVEGALLLGVYLAYLIVLLR